MVSHTSQNAFCQLSENMSQPVGLQVERTLMIVTAGDRVVAGEKKRELCLSFTVLWAVEITELLIYLL